MEENMAISKLMQGRLLIWDRAFNDIGACRDPEMKFSDFRAGTV
jgi:hypothetical protein